MTAFNVVVIEDNPADVFLLRRSMEQMGLECSLTVAVDGEEGLDCLFRRNKFEGCANADLILLDMHLPKLDGLEILKRTPDAAHLPICMLTSSARERPLVEAQLGRSVAYLIKPVTPEKLRNCLRSHEHLRRLVGEVIP